MRYAILVLFLVAAPASAGIHYSAQPTNDLPVEWAGFLRDLRMLRLAASPAGFSPLHDTYTEAATKLETQAKTKPLTADEAADLGALYLRLGKPAKALEILRPAARTHSEHFRLASNLGTAWQLHGDLDQAALALAEATALAPEKWKETEKLHLKLVRLRLKEKKETESLDDLFGLKFVGESGKPEAGAISAAEKKLLPANAVAQVQQLLLWLPNDPKLLWLLAELANADGDVNTAANLMEGVVGEFALKSEDARVRRTLYRAAADERAKKEEHSLHRGTLKFASSRVFTKLIDESKLPKIDLKGVNSLPWAALAETTVGKKFDPKYLKYVTELDDRTITITGYVRPNGDGLDMAEFLLTEFPIGCWFCESPGPTQVLWVELAGGKTIDFKREPLQIVGKLKLNKLDPEGYLFRIVEAKVKKVE